MSLRRASRVSNLAAAAVLFVLASWSGGAYCAMNGAPSSEPSPDTHACCDTGITATPPGCCDVAVEGMGTVGIRVRDVSLSPVAAAPHVGTIPLAANVRAVGSPAAAHVHSPPAPPLVLRV